MENNLFTITRRSIPYIKQARTVAGSVTATILWQQIEHWFHVQQKPFYKFMEKCEHPAYKNGDSWCEELGFSPDEFRTAYSKLGVKYDSKAEFESAKRNGELFLNEKGEEKMYACFYDKIGRLTTYYRNDKFVEKQIDRVYERTTPSAQMESPMSPNVSSNVEDTEITYRDILSYFFDLNSLETDASVREAFQNADQFLKDGKYLGLIQSKDGTIPMLCVNLPTFKPVYIVSIESLWKLSFEQISELIKPLNNVSHLWPFKGYYIKFDDVRIRKGDELATAAGMGETPQPNADMKQLFNL